MSSHSTFDANPAVPKPNSLADDALCEMGEHAHYRTVPGDYSRSKPLEYAIPDDHPELQEDRYVVPGGGIHAWLHKTSPDGRHWFAVPQGMPRREETLPGMEWLPVAYAFSSDVRGKAKQLCGGKVKLWFEATDPSLTWSWEVDCEIKLQELLRALCLHLDTAPSALHINRDHPFWETAIAFSMSLYSLPQLRLIELLGQKGDNDWGLLGLKQKAGTEDLEVPEYIVRIMPNPRSRR